MDSFAAQQVKNDIVKFSGGQVKPGSFEADVKDYIDKSYPTDGKSYLMNETGAKSDPKLYQMRIQDVLQEISECTPVMTSSDVLGSVDQPFKTMEYLAMKYGDTYR